MRENQDIYLVNEGANTLDNARNIIDMYKPRRRLDCGTWGVMGIGMGYAIGASVTSGSPVVAIEGDSAFGFSGMEIETICRYNLPVTIVIFNNGGIYRGCLLYTSRFYRMFFPRGDEHNKRFMGELADVLCQQHTIQRRNIDIQKNGVDAVMLQKLQHVQTVVKGADNLHLAVLFN